MAIVSGKAVTLVSTSAASTDARRGGDAFPLFLLASRTRTLAELPTFMVWHQRYQKDPAHRWIRNQSRARIPGVRWRDNADECPGAGLAGSPPQSSRAVHAA